MLLLLFMASIAAEAEAVSAAEISVEAKSETPPANITPPYWLTRPSTEDVALVYPRAAAVRGVGGSAVIQCVIGPDGSMASCVVLEERPGGYGFGTAALRLSTRFKLKPAERNGVPETGGTIKIPMRFRR